MAKGYVTQMTYITQEVLAQGRFDAGAKISGQMMKEGNMDFMKVWNEARKAQGGEEATDEDPKSVKDQLKEAVGSVSSNAKSKITGRLSSTSLVCVIARSVDMLWCFPASCQNLTAVARHQYHVCCPKCCSVLTAVLTL